MCNLPPKIPFLQYFYSLIVFVAAAVALKL